MSARRREIPISRLGVICFFSVLFFLAAGRLNAQSHGWPQWGRSNRNFKSEAKGLASNWPAAGPRKLWSRPLGEGYSAIVARDRREMIDSVVVKDALPLDVTSQVNDGN